MSHVFVSYVRDNQAQISRLCSDLEARGVTVWLDRNEISPGQRWKQAIRVAIKNGAFFLACFSAEYAERSKTYMNEELILAIEELRQRRGGRTWFIPILLSKCEVPDMDIGAGSSLRDFQWLDLSENRSSNLEQLFRIIQPGLSRQRKGQWLAADLHHLVGVLVGENEWSASEDGYLAYGPYISLAPGRYAAIYHLKIADVSANSLSDRVARIDVTSNGASKVIDERVLMRSCFSQSDVYQQFEVPFELAKEEDRVEMRVRCIGRAQITLREIELLESK